MTAPLPPDPNIWRGVQWWNASLGGQDDAFGQDRSRATRDVLIYPYSKHYTAAKAFLGFPAVVPLSGSGYSYVSRQTPMPLYEMDGGDVYINHSGKDFLYATSIEKCAPFGVLVDSGGDYEGAKLTLVFESLPWDILEDGQLPRDSLHAAPYEANFVNGNTNDVPTSRYITWAVEPEVQYLQVGRGQLFIAAGYTGQSNPFPYPGGRVIGKCALRVIWHQVPRRAISSRQIWDFSGTAFIDDTLGKVNADTWNGYPPGTLLLEGVRFHPGRSPWGDRIYEVEFVFGVNYHKWNYVYWPAASGYVLIQSDPPAPAVPDNDVGANDGRRLYDSRRFEYLFLCPIA